MLAMIQTLISFFLDFKKEIITIIILILCFMNPKYINKLDISKRDVND